MFRLLQKAKVLFDMEAHEDRILFSTWVPKENGFDCVGESQGDYVSGFMWMYDVALKYCRDLPTKVVRIDIPYLPPGINANYGYGDQKVYKTKESKQWEEKSALIVGSTVNVAGWDYQEGKEYGIVIIWSGTRLDVDAPIKIIIDMITRKIGFDDKHIKMIQSNKIEGKEEKLIIFLGEI